MAKNPTPGDSSLNAGHMLGRYRLERELGRGGAAIVYRAFDTEMERTVAVKMLLNECSTEIRKRFLREARVAAGLHHPNIVKVHEVAESGGLPYIVMELIEGMPLDLSLPREEALETLSKMAHALEEAHRHGVVHRDLKPANVLVDSRGEPHILDFGLARLEDAGERLTQTGAVLGTPLYMSPEQVAGRTDRIGPATDVYALGAILYEHLSGRPPHMGDAISEVYDKILHEEPRMPEGPRDLVTLCMKSMAKDPALRYQSAREFAEDLDRFLVGKPIVARPPSAWSRFRHGAARHPAVLASLATTLVGVVVIALVIATRSEPDNQKDLERVREIARKREENLKILGALWAKILLAKQGFHNASTDPAKVRSRIRVAVERMTLYLEKNPNEPQGFYVRARGLMYLDDLEAAEKDLRKAVDLEKDFAPGHALLGRVLMERFLEKLYGTAGEAPERARRAAPILEAARKSLARGWGKGAEEVSITKWGLAKTPEDEISEVIAKALWVHYVKNDREGSRQVLREAIQKEEAAEYHNWLGAWSQGSDEKIARFSRALELMPHYTRAYLHRGSTYYEIGELDKALDDFTASIRCSPRFSTAYFNRGRLQIERGQREKAVEDFTKAIEFDPKQLGAYNNRAVLRHQNGDLQAAIQDYTKAIELQHDNRDAIMNRAIAYSQLKQHGKSIDDYTQLLKFEPRNARIFNNRGNEREKSGNVPGAIRDYTLAIEADSNYAGAYMNRARMRGNLALKDASRARELFKGAVADLKKALEVTPKNWKYRPYAERMLRRTRKKLNALDERN